MNKVQAVFSVIVMSFILISKVEAVVIVGEKGMQDAGDGISVIHVPSPRNYYEETINLSAKLVPATCNVSVDNPDLDFGTLESGDADKTMEFAVNVECDTVFPPDSLSVSMFSPDVSSLISGAPSCLVTVLWGEVCSGDDVIVPVLQGESKIGKRWQKSFFYEVKPVSIPLFNEPDGVMSREGTLFNRCHIRALVDLSGRNESKCYFHWNQGKGDKYSSETSRKLVFSVVRIMNKELPLIPGEYRNSFGIKIQYD
ncbi:hypothetical protein RJV04_005089 [Salmonella enterica]|nr:hypothetical protein [Salmonella enterica]